MREIREAKAALEAGALAEAEQADREGGNHPGVPDDRAQRNFTDPDSRIMPGPGRQDFQQSYNCQAVVDSTHQVIVAARATNATSDKQQAVAMVEETTGNVGAVPREVSADAGYYSVKAVEELYALGANPFIAPEKTRHGRVLEPAPRGRIPKGLSVRDRMRRKLRTKRGRERYALRMETVEPVFGQIKQGRGFRQFLLRGLAKVNREWLLICAGHNLLKLFRFGAGMSGNVRGKGATGNNKESCQAIGSGVFERRPGYVHPHHAGFVATGESWPINRVSWSILRQAPSDRFNSSSAIRWMVLPSPLSSMAPLPQTCSSRTTPSKGATDHDAGSAGTTSMWWSRSSGGRRSLPGSGLPSAFSLATTFVFRGADSNDEASIPSPFRTSVRNCPASPVLRGGFEVSSLM